jgi:hypothetical protein
LRITSTRRNPTFLVHPDRGFVVGHAGIANGKFHGVTAPTIPSPLALPVLVDTRPERTDVLAAHPERLSREALKSLCAHGVRDSAV